VESTAAAPENWVAAFSLEDRLGSYGLIGVMIARSGGQTLWEIDTWLMSCRVLGRQMEKFMFDRLVEAAAARGIREIAGIYHPTEKNVLVRDLYPQFGFTAVENGQGGQRYTFSLPKRLEPTATHVLQV
jgi:FkbH-like protein